jgi:hypothetical protein
MKSYIDGDMPYPLCIVGGDSGKSILIENVSCYRADRNFGYRLQKTSAKFNVVLAAPRQAPKTSDDNYTFEDDRYILYMTLMAAVTAANQSRCQVLVVSDFGCGAMGHPPREVASMLYKVLYEFKSCFKAVVIAISPRSAESREHASSYEHFVRTFQEPNKHLLYWNGLFPSSVPNKE